MRLLTACALTTRSSCASTVYTVVVAHCPWKRPGCGQPRDTHRQPAPGHARHLLQRDRRRALAGGSSSGASVACHTRTHTPSIVWSPAAVSGMLRTPELPSGLTVSVRPCGPGASDTLAVWPARSVTVRVRAPVAVPPAGTAIASLRRP